MVKIAKAIRLYLKFISALTFFTISSHAEAHLIGYDNEPATHHEEEFFLNLPPRNENALSGTQFIRSTEYMDYDDRENAIFDEIAAGNIPSFLRRFVPVDTSGEFSDGKPYKATFYVNTDYLSVGSDQDYVRVPVNFMTALLLMDLLGVMIPTKKMVDIIYATSKTRLKPQPLPISGMRTSAFFFAHNSLIKTQCDELGVTDGQLLSGHKKDIVFARLLLAHVSHEMPVAIYGWHTAIGKPIQAASTIHEAEYSDYSHGIRLVAPFMDINGRKFSVREVLQDNHLSEILSEVGVVPVDTIIALFQGH